MGKISRWIFGNKKAAPTTTESDIDPRWKIQVKEDLVQGRWHWKLEDTKIGGGSRQREFTSIPKTGTGPTKSSAVKRAKMRAKEYEATEKNRQQTWETI